MIDLAKKKVSPTLYKMLDSYLADKETGEGKVCGYLIKQTLEGKIAEEDLDKEAFRFGSYFEYICTGGYMEHKGIPQPETTSTGDLTAAYKQLHWLKNHYKRYYDYLTVVLGWKELRLGYKYNKHEKATGIEDIAFEKPDGTEVIVDMKLTALFSDEYKPYGWGLGRLQDKKMHILQAPFYTWLRFEECGKMPEFQYWVFDRQANDKNGKPPFKVISVVVDSGTIERLSVEVAGAHNYFHKVFLKEKDSDLAKPSYENCYGCPAQNCPFRAIFPKPYEIIY